MITILLLLLLSLSGCSATNISALIEQLAKDPAANCISIGTPYGSVMLARGTPQASVNISGGSCTIRGAGVTPVQVPVKVNVAPTQ